MTERVHVCDFRPGIHKAKTATLLMVQCFITLAASSTTEYSNTNEISLLINSLKRVQLNKENSVQRRDDIDFLNDILKYSTPNVYSETDETSKNYKQLGHNKDKRGWEEIQRSWRSHFPKRAWEVVSSYWRSPKFRSAFKSYIGKRSDEAIAEIPIQPENQNDIWMIDELGYDIDGYKNIIPEFLKDNIDTGEKETDDFLYSVDEKRGWEDIPTYSYNRLGKRGWEDIRLTPLNQFGRRGWQDFPVYAFNRLGKRGWEDIRLFSNNRYGKRELDDFRPFQNEQIDKRDFEDVSLFPRYTFSSRERDHIPLLPTYFNKRGWEEIPKLYGNRLGKRGWEDVRLFPNWRFGQRQSSKRGWEDVGYFNPRRLGKRGWEDVRLYKNSRV